MLTCPGSDFEALSPGQSAHELDNPVGKQVVGILHRTPAEDRCGVQSNLEFARLQIPDALCIGERLLEDIAGLLVDDQLRAEQLQRALGEWT